MKILISYIIIIIIIIFFFFVLQFPIYHIIIIIYETVCCLFRQLYVFLRLTSMRHPDLSRAESEKTYRNPATSKEEPFPSITDPPSLYLSLVVPAYKEENRRKWEAPSITSRLYCSPRFVIINKMIRSLYPGKALY